MPFIFKSTQFNWDNATKWLVAEASTLQLPPGAWPEAIIVESHKTGNGLIFERDNPIIAGAEFGGYVYKANFDGIPLEAHVLND